MREGKEGDKGKDRGDGKEIKGFGVGKGERMAKRKGRRERRR